MGKGIGKVLKGTASYLLKYRPYVTVWVICCIGVGIYGGIQKQSAAPLTACLIFALVPAAIRGLLLVMSRIGGRNRYDEELLKIAPRGRFMDYMNQYTKK